MHNFFSLLRRQSAPVPNELTPAFDRRDRHEILKEAVGLFQNSVEGRIEFAKEVAAAAQNQFGHHRETIFLFASGVQVRNA